MTHQSKSTGRVADPERPGAPGQHPSAFPLRARLGAAVRATWSVVRAGARGLRDYTHALMGDSAYAHYCAHAAATHPGAPVMTEREFWRERMAAQDRNPGARCC